MASSNSSKAIAQQRKEAAKRRKQAQKLAKRRQRMMEKLPQKRVESVMRAFGRHTGDHLFITYVVCWFVVFVIVFSCGGFAFGYQATSAWVIVMSILCIPLAYTIAGMRLWKKKYKAEYLHARGSGGYRGFSAGSTVVTFGQVMLNIANAALTAVYAVGSAVAIMVTALFAAALAVIAF